MQWTRERAHTATTVRMSAFIPGEGGRVERNEAAEVAGIQFEKDLCLLSVEILSPEVSKQLLHWSFHFQRGLCDPLTHQLI